MVVCDICLSKDSVRHCVLDLGTYHTNGKLDEGDYCIRCRKDLQGVIDKSLEEMRYRYLTSKAEAPQKFL
jgi:hypothetical protein